MASLPSNEELLNKRSQWGTDVFLIQASQGYLFIPVDELEFLQAHADEKLQVHSLLLTPQTRSVIKMSTQQALQNRNLDCESVRVLSDRGIELAYSPQCSLVVADSGWELARANEQAQLTAAQKSNQPILIFRPKDKPASALPLNVLIDAPQDSIQNLEVDTLVPVYNLEDVENEEKEDAINLSIADAIKRTLQFFPEQKEFEVLMPEQELAFERVKYSSILPEKFSVKYDYDKVNVVVPTGNQPVTFYSLRESVAEPLPEGVTAMSQNDLMTSTGDWNKDYIIELSQNLHKTRDAPYIIVKTNQDRFYGGSLRQLKETFPKVGESPKELTAMVTRLVGTDFWGTIYQGQPNLGWLSNVSTKLLEHSKSLKIDPNPNTTVAVWSFAGKRQAVFTADGVLQLEQMIQWQTRPDNQTLRAIRQTWRGNMLLVYVPDKGYLLAQPNEVKLLLNIAPIQIDSLVLSFEAEKEFSYVITQTSKAFVGLPVQESTRVLFSSMHNLAELPFYDGIDLAFYLDNRREPQIDLGNSGLELTQSPPEHWLDYAEAKGSPLAIFQWPDGKKSLALFEHIAKAKRDAEKDVDIGPQILVPSYNFEDLDESMLDKEEIEESIATSLLDTLQRALAFWPDQNSFQVVMPHEKSPRHYSQEPPSQIQSDSLGVIEVTRQLDNTKIKYYYRP